MRQTRGEALWNLAYLKDERDPLCRVGVVTKSISESPFILTSVRQSHPRWRSLLQRKRSSAIQIFVLAVVPSFLFLVYRMLFLVFFATSRKTHLVILHREVFFFKNSMRSWGTRFPPVSTYSEITLGRWSHSFERTILKIDSLDRRDESLW